MKSSSLRTFHFLECKLYTAVTAPGGTVWYGTGTSQFRSGSLGPVSGPDPQHSLPVDVLSMESPAQGQTVLTKSVNTSGNTSERVPSI
jgi:hypothetical protein